MTISSPTGGNPASVAARLHKAIDLSHHLSDLAKSREVSPLKGIQKYPARPGTISLAGGKPDPAYFPFASVSADVLVPESFPQPNPSESSLFGWFWSLFGAPAGKSERMTIPKYKTHEGDVDLATVLQYGPAMANKPLQRFFRDFTAKVFKPGYADWDVLIDVGNTDGIHRSLSTLCNPGEFVFVEEWTYPPFMEDSMPMDILPVPIKVDGQGMSAANLELVLSTWDEAARGAKRPHVMYTIPVGQNPTGLTTSTERKKAIYDICVKYDIMIVEDDPYYFLQEGTYRRKELRNRFSMTTTPLKSDEDEETQYLNSLPTPYLRLDYQGRVIRLDTFSLTLAPGCRLGWFTCNPLFSERFERHGETGGTGFSCGFSQAIAAQLLSKHWGIPKYLRWLQGIQTQYTVRRDLFVDCIFDAFEVRFASGSALQDTSGQELPVFTAYTKTAVDGSHGDDELRLKKHIAEIPLFSFAPPTAGIYVWLKLHLQDCARKPKGPNEPDGQTLEDEIWADLANHGLLVAPGKYFSGDQNHKGQGSGVDSISTQEMAIRLGFGMSTLEDMKNGMNILADVLKSYVVI